MQRIVLPFLAGFLAVIFFQQPTVELLHLAGASANTAYPLLPVPPLGVPEFIMGALIDGLAAIVMAWLLRVSPTRPAPWMGALVFGGVALTAVSIFVVGPIRGEWPSGNILPRLAFEFVVDAMWGWGALVFMRAFMGTETGE
ncbi:MAG: hypothetical protein WDN30_14520 [Pararobbsia sp.]